MSSTPTTVATPIRQPRGPSNTNTFTSLGPPLPDVDSLRRSNTVSTPRHQGSASISSSAIGSSAFHGGMRFKNGQSRFRSGSLSSSNVSAETLVRKGSGRAVQTQEVVIESGEEAAIPIPPTETGSGWGKGLARQSSLPSRKGEQMAFVCTLHMLTRSQCSILHRRCRPMRRRCLLPLHDLHVESRMRRRTLSIPLYQLTLRLTRCHP